MPPEAVLPVEAAAATAKGDRNESAKVTRVEALNSVTASLTGSENRAILAEGSRQGEFLAHRLRARARVAK